MLSLATKPTENDIGGTNTPFATDGLGQKKTKKTTFSPIENSADINTMTASQKNSVSKAVFLIC